MKQELKKQKNDNNLTEWLNEPSCDDLKADLTAASSSHEKFKAKLLEYAQDMDGGKEVIPSKPGKSTVRPKLIRKNAEWKYPSLEDPFLNTADMYEINPRTWEDREAAEQNQLLLNHQWSTKIKKVKFVNDVVRYVVDDGSVVVKVGWEVEEVRITEEQEQPVYASPEESLILMEQAVATGQMSMEEYQARIEAGEPVQIGVEMVEVEVPKVIKNQPKYEVCNTANVVIDPTCEGDLDQASFVIHEYDTNIANLKKEEYIKDVETGEVAGVYHNLKLLKDDDGVALYDQHKSEAYNEFKFNDKARKKLTAYDYWGYWDINGDDVLVPIVATWIGDVLVRLEENPFPHGKLPFAIATYMPKKKEVMGEPDAAILKDNQESIGKLLRASHDITSEHAVGQEFIEETFFPSLAVKAEYEAGNTVYYRAGMNPNLAIHKKSIEPVPNTVFNMINMYQEESDALSGTKSFSGGISGNALGDSVGGARSALDATSKRELSILRRLSELFIDIARLTISMNQAYLSEEEVVRVTNEKFVVIRRDELAGEFDLKVDVSTPEKDEDTANKLNMDPAEARIYRAKIAKLWKQPDLAKAIETYEPKPDPVQQELQQMQLEKAKIELQIARKELEDIDSKILERVSRVEENMKADVDMKQAKAEEARARAVLAIEQADALANEFVKDVSGQNRAELERDKEFDARVEMAKKETSKVSDGKITQQQGEN